MPLVAAPDPRAIPLHVLDPGSLADWLERQDAATRTWVGAMGFEAGSGEVLCLPASDGGLRAALAGWGKPESRRRERFALAAAAAKLPAGRYVIGEDAVGIDAGLEALGWLLSDYRFQRYRKGPAPKAELVCPEGVDAARLVQIADAARLAQDLVNTPARDMGPEALEAAFVALGERHGAALRVIRGPAALRAERLHMIEAVGAAASEVPRLLDLVWGRPDAPKITLVGKGVCFDTGGLDIKPPASMGIMKKDMGGAATAMGLAGMIMGLGLDLRLRLLVPAVENAISGPAMRPGDILPSRKGLTVEVNNTDAEGRLVLADALALADEEVPDLIVSLATLTGAARVALGPDVPPFFTDDDALAADLAAASAAVADPLWRLPFWDPYEPLIEPGIADLDNAPSGGMAGAITAALFLRRFVTASPRYVHLDIYGWTPVAKPARPKGGAFQAARALLDLLESAILLDDVTPFANRLLPARPDLAAEHLRGRVDAKRYVPGEVRRVTAAAPRPDDFAGPGERARHSTALWRGIHRLRDPGGRARLGSGGARRLCGLRARRRAWRRRGARSNGSRRSGPTSTRGPRIGRRRSDELPFLAEVEIDAEGGNARYAALRGGGFVPRRHLEPVAGDFVMQAERFLGVPYLWGGRSARGIDCSALVQLSLIACGRQTPRDADMQAAMVGEKQAPDEPAQRGDLIFWKGHVGILHDPETLLHANAHAMAVAFEPLGAAIARIEAAGGGPVTARRRP